MLHNNIIYDIMLHNNIIIGIINCKKNEHKQNDIRKTWIKDLNYYNIKYYFIIGHNKKTEIIDDIIYLNCNDDYESLTNKVGLFTKYVYENTDYEYIYKLDDDCYLNIEYFMNINLKDVNFLGKFISKNDYLPNWGYQYNKNKLIEKTIYFDFFGGGYGYIFNRECMKIICDNFNLFNSYFLEDVSIAKILYDFGNIRAKKLDYDTSNLIYNKHYFKCIIITNVNDFTQLYNKIKVKYMNIEDFIKLNSIKQISRSKGVSNMDSMQDDYIDEQAITLFYGMYNLEDYKMFFNHIGKKYIYWCGNDSKINNKLKLQLLTKLSCTTYEGNICCSDIVEIELKKVKISIINLSSKRKEIIENICGSEAGYNIPQEQNKSIPVNSNRKLYTKMVGGLGNQLFMFFNLISLAKEYNMDFDVCFDKNYKKHHPSENYSLFKNIKFNELSNEELKDYEIYQEPEFKYNKILLDNKNYHIKGYFQSYKYFIDYKDEIKKYIYIDNDKISKIKNIFNSYGKKILSIHMRLADYIEFKDYHYNCSIEYYKHALAKYNLDEYQMILFSDDFQLANSMLKDLNLNYINSNELFENDEDQFYMLALSNVSICPASSFSLMSCYFNEIFNFVDDCEYTFPEKWFSERGPKYNIYDLIIYNHTNFIKSKNNFIIKNLKGINNDITLVSGYWALNKNKFSNFKYLEWFNISLCVNSPLVFFTDSQSIINFIKEVRKDLPTHYVLLDLNEFETNKYKDLYIIDSRQCPSKELNMIWNEKIFLIQKSSNINPFNSNYYCWYDAGLCRFRDVKIPENKLNSSFLKNDKISFTNPNHVTKFEKNKLKNYGYHYITGTSYIIPKNIIPRITKIYEDYLYKYVDNKNLWTDQVIWTHIYSDYPELFENISQGYGYVILKLLGMC
jgi:hypothetical protein